MTPARPPTRGGARAGARQPLIDSSVGDLPYRARIQGGEEMKLVPLRPSTSPPSASQIQEVVRTGARPPPQLHTHDASGRRHSRRGPQPRQVLLSLAPPRHPSLSPSSCYRRGRTTTVWSPRHARRGWGARGPHLPVKELRHSFFSRGVGRRLQNDGGDEGYRCGVFSFIVVLEEADEGAGAYGLSAAYLKKKEIQQKKSK